MEDLRVFLNLSSSKLLMKTDIVVKQTPPQSAIADISLLLEPIKTIYCYKKCA